MSNKTPIQWCDSTCNPTMGCEGCELWNANTKKCYAGRRHVRFGGVTKGYSPIFEQLTQFPGRMAKAARCRDLTGTARKDKPWLDGLPRLIFVSDMSDALSSAVPFEYLEKEVIREVSSPKGQRHCWLWLTKRPERMAQFSAMLKAKSIAWPQNLWAGTSITTQATTPRIDQLLRVGDDNTIRFLSVEPQHEELDLRQWLPRLDWLIQGGASGSKPVPFDLEWAIDMIEQCKHAGVPYFLKQLGSVVVSKGQRLTFNNSHAGDWSEWPEEVRVREMPRRIMIKAEGALILPTETQTPLIVTESQIVETRAPNVEEAGRKKRTRSKTVRKTLNDCDSVVTASAASNLCATEVK